MPLRLAALALLWAGFAFVPELVLNSPRPFERGVVGAAVFALTALASLSTWWLFATAIASLRARSPKLGWLAIAMVGPPGALLTVGSIHYRWFFGTDVRPIAIAYFLQNPGYAASLVESSLTPTVRLGLSCVVLFGIATLAIVTAKPFPRRVRAPGWIGVVVVLAIALVSIPAIGCGKYPCIAEVRGVRALLQGIVARGFSEPLHALPVPKRRTVAPSTPTRRPDIVLIVGESLGADRVAPWNGEPPGLGGVMELFASHEDHVAWFPDAVAVAPVTAISVPSTLSGLSPDAPVDDYARAPLLWHEARARGYATAFMSAQDFRVDFFQGFYLSDGGPDVHANASDHPGLPRVNDRGVADEVAVDDALAFVERTPRETPLFLVLQMNATHWPCWAPELEGDETSAIPERCTHAVRYVDRELRRFADGFARARDLESALLVATSDHGESFDPSRPARSVNYYQGVLRVPLVVHLPAAMATGSPELVRTFLENRRRRASNLDVVPTILDVWGSWPDDGRTPRAAGASLLRPLPEARPMIAMAESAIWDPVADGFALFDGKSKWIVDEFHGVRLFDLSADPGETTNLADRAPADAIARFRAEIEKHPRAALVCRRFARSVLEGPYAAASW